MDEILKVLEAQGHSVAALDKLLAKALSLLDGGGGMFMHSQAARLLEVAAAFATAVLRKQAVAAWRERQQAANPSWQTSGLNVWRQPATSSSSRVRRSPTPHQQGLSNRQSMAVSAEIVNLCHHLETIRKLQDLAEKRTASAYNQPSHAAEEASPEPNGEPLAVALSKHGTRSDRGVRIVGIQGLASTLNGQLGAFDWSLPGERALVTKGGKDPSRAKELEPSGAITAAGAGDLAPSDESEEPRPADLVARWGREDSPPQVVVRDALRVGRLALAVAYLQKKRGVNVSGGRVFAEVRECGRRLAYDFFRAGNTDTALQALRRLGENADQALRELAMGSLHRDIRDRAAAELRGRELLTKQEARALRILSDLEAAYPEDSFWRAYRVRSKQATAAEAVGTVVGLRAADGKGNKGDVIEVTCGEVDGAVLGVWGAFAESNGKAEETGKENVEDSGGEWYLRLVADWVSRWDRMTIERIYLERGLAPPTPISWQAQLQYHVAHHDWLKVEPLLENVPPECLGESVLRVKATQVEDSSSASPNSDVVSNGEEDLYVPGVKLLLVDISQLCTRLMRGLVEEKLARQHVFLQTDWEGTGPLVTLLSRAGVLFAPGGPSNDQAGSEPPSDVPSSSEESAEPGQAGRTAVEYAGGSDSGVYVVHDREGLSPSPLAGAHAVVVRDCAERGLPQLLQAYLDWHGVGRDPGDLEPLQLAAGRCEWAHWLLLSRVPGEEYAASFANARFIWERSQTDASPGTLPPFPATLDDMAQGGHELRALATLVHAPVPLEECVDGSAEPTRQPSDLGNLHLERDPSGQDLPSWYCRLGSLTRALEPYPTLWKLLEQVCGVGAQPALEEAPGLEEFWDAASLDSVLGPYVRWRHSLLTSAARDASLLSMLPPSTAPAIRRVVSMAVLGPASRGPTTLPSAGNDRLSEWEDAADDLVAHELSLHEEDGPRGFAVQHLLRKGRPLAALERVLAYREKEASQQGPANESGETSRSPGPAGGHEGKRHSREGKMRSGQGQDTWAEQARRQRSGLQDGDTAGDGEERGRGRLRDLLTDEEFLVVLKEAVPLAIRAYDNARVTTACCAFLELCGVPATELRVDLVALQRAQEAGDSESVPIATLAAALSDAYVASIEDANPAVRNAPPPPGTCQAVLDLLGQLEGATLSTLAEEERPAGPPSRWGRAKTGGKERGTAGRWLRDGEGDNRRTAQMEASERWDLVTAFCTAHGLPPSEAYLRQLARDDDWLGFLAEAQKEGTPLDRLTAVAVESFSDPALKEHVLIVLRSLGSNVGPAEKDQAGPAPALDANPATPELFAVLAECEKGPHPGSVLLEKARDLGWPLLAIAASAYEGADVISCLATWLATTAPEVNAPVRPTREAAVLAQTVEGAVRKLNSVTRALDEGEGNEQERERRPAKRRRISLDQAQGNTVGDAEAEPSSLAGEAAASGRASAGEALVETVARLSGRALFLPLLRGLELFAPGSSLVDFVRALQAAARYDREGAAAHLERFGRKLSNSRGDAEVLGGGLAARAAVAAADAALASCATEFERELLLEVLAGLQEWGPAAEDGARYKRFSLAGRLSGLRGSVDEACTSESLLETLAAARKWDDARELAQQLDNGGYHDFPATSRERADLEGTARRKAGAEEHDNAHRGGGLLDHVTLLQAEALLAEWRELLWDDPAERLAIWGHCSALFATHGLPAWQAGDFFVRHAEELSVGDPPAPAAEVHAALLLAVQWLSGSFSGGSQTALDKERSALEAELWRAAIAADREAGLLPGDPIPVEASKLSQRQAQGALQATAELWSAISGEEPRAGSKNLLGRQNSATERWAKEGRVTRPGLDLVETSAASEERSDADIAPAVSALLEVGHISAARGLLRQLDVPPGVNVQLVQAAECVAAGGTAALPPQLADGLRERGVDLPKSTWPKPEGRNERSEVLRKIGELCPAREGRGHVLRLAAVCQAAAALSLGYREAGKTTPLELLQLLALQAGRSGVLDAARQLGIAYEGQEELPPRKVARVLAECFQKGLVAAHKGGYLGDGPSDEAGPAPLLWKPEDFVQWAAVCPEPPQVAHALMRLVIGGRSDLPPACEAELLVLAHRFYASSSCFDGLDVLSALVSNRAAAYLAEDNVAPVARLLVGTGDFVRLRALADALVRDGHLDLLLTKLSSSGAQRMSSASRHTARAVILSALARQRKDHSDEEYEAALARVYDTLGAQHEAAASLERRAGASVKRAAAQRESSPTPLGRLTPSQSGSDKELLKAMELFVQAAEKWSQLEAGSAAARCAHQAALVAVQLRLPDVRWLDLSSDSARQLFVEQPGGFPEALTVAQAYGLMDPLQWGHAIWNQVMWQPLNHTERYLDDFAATLPLAPPLLMELARAYRTEVAERDADMSRWLPSGAGGAESGRHLGRAFKTLLYHVADYKLRLQVATLATGFPDVVDDTIRMLDKVPETAGPLILRKGHGATYVPLM